MLEFQVFTRISGFPRKLSMKSFRFFFFLSFGAMIIISSCFLYTDGVWGKDITPCELPYSNKTMPCAFANCPNNTCPRFDYYDSVKLQCEDPLNSAALFFLICGFTGLCFLLGELLYQNFNKPTVKILLSCLGIAYGLFFIAGSIYFMYKVITTPNKFACDTRGTLCKSQDVEDNVSPCFAANCRVNDCLTINGISWKCYGANSPYVFLIPSVFGIIFGLILTVFCVRFLQSQIKQLGLRPNFTRLVDDVPIDTFR